MTPTDPSWRSYEALYAEYVVQRLTVRQIAALHGVSANTALNALHAVKIPMRARGHLRGADHPNWRGGVTITARNYRLIRLADHPNAWEAGYVREHIVVALKAAGRRHLEPNECVHHINFDRLDNRPENLHICLRSEHTTYHARLEQLTRELMDYGFVRFDPERGYVIVTADAEEMGSGA